MEFTTMQLTINFMSHPPSITILMILSRPLLYHDSINKFCQDILSYSPSLSKHILCPHKNWLSNAIKKGMHERILVAIKLFLFE